MNRREKAISEEKNKESRSGIHSTNLCQGERGDVSKENATICY